MALNTEIFTFRPFKVERVHFTNDGVACPRPRSGHRIVCTSGTLVSFGGYNPNPPQTAGVSDDSPSWSLAKPVFKELWKFCFASRRWRLCRIIDSIPDELASNAVYLYGNVLMIFGGTGCPFGYKCSNRVYCYDTSELQASIDKEEVKQESGLMLLDATGSLPPPQYGQAIACLGNTLYTVGGTNGYLYNSDVHKLDLRTLQWENVWICHGDQTDVPEGRYRHEMATDGRRLLVLAGGTTDWAAGFNVMPIFDTVTGSWSIVRTLAYITEIGPLYPSPRICHSAVQIQTENDIQVFITGGSNSQFVFDDLWRLKVSTLQWTKMEQSSLPKSLFFHSSAVTPEGCMYTFGGIEVKNSENIRTNDLFKVWLCIPKLSEVCWEALLHYCPKICDMDKSKLLNSGIPKRFVDRLVF